MSEDKHRERFHHNESKILKELWDVLSKIYKVIKNIQNKPEDEESNFDIDSKISVSDLKVLLMAIFAIKGYKRIILDNSASK
jgi:hypothetical protein